MSLFSSKQKATLNVRGMHCEKCVAHVTEALEGVEGVTGVSVGLDAGSAEVEGRGFDGQALVAAVEAAGFQASLAS